MKCNLASRYGAAAGIVGLALLAQHFFLHRLSEQFFYEGALIRFREALTLAHDS